MKHNSLSLLCWFIMACGLFPLSAQQKNLLTIPEPGEKTLVNSGWLARKANEMKTDGNTLSTAPLDKAGWMPARVPGTVLTTLLENNLYPAPEFGMNNNLIPDIYEAGNDFYTYWFVCQFETPTLQEGRAVWLNFRGINYKAELFMNGKRLNNTTHEGMFLRKSFDITDHLRKEGTNILAVLVYPPTYPGDPNGGQGGDGLIARNNTMQYTPGWDWVQPIRDRNTGIWDEVSITTTGAVTVRSPYVVTKVPGVRSPEKKTQEDAFVKTSVEVENITDTPCKGVLVCETNGMRLTEQLTLSPYEKKEVQFNPLKIKNPRLWWPNGIGEQPLYDMHIYFESDNRISDSERLKYGIREITSDKCPDNGGRRFFVNGQKVYMTGGNYISSDWLLRLSPERYRDEVRFHAEMNLRMIRVWGGALLERPEFYTACDEFGILVFQDLWGSGDCNGAWEDPMKTDSRQRRWEYPDNHDLFIASVEDQVKMIRNHPSLCLWCGANEWPLAKNIDKQLKEKVFPQLDPERLFVSYSTDSLFTRNLLGDNGDGPYGIQEPEWFFTFRSHPFNPEAGSVGSPEVESMREMMTERDLAGFPRKGFTRNATWRYHRDLGYQDHLERYGEVKDIETYCKYAQVVNYDQYRSFMEGWGSHLWDWYTGILIWKTQNPWTSLRGQMYDWFLDVNASLYGTRKGCEPLHPFYNPVTRQVELLNTTLSDYPDLIINARIYDTGGKIRWEKEIKSDAKANTVAPLFDVPVPEEIKGVYFLRLSMQTADPDRPSNADAVLPETPNIYWLTTLPKDYSGLTRLPEAKPEVKVSLQREGTTYSGMVSLHSKTNISFFNRIKVLDKETGKRILPVHYSDNYLTLMPGDYSTFKISFTTSLPEDRIQVVVDSWTSERIVTTVSYL